MAGRFFSKALEVCVSSLCARSGSAGACVIWMFGARGRYVCTRMLHWTLFLRVLRTRGVCIILPP